MNAQTKIATATRRLSTHLGPLLDSAGLDPITAGVVKVSLPLVEQMLGEAADKIEVDDDLEAHDRAIEEAIWLVSQFRSDGAPVLTVGAGGVWVGDGDVPLEPPAWARQLAAEALRS